MTDIPSCLTSTIDRYSTIGDRYYHNIENNNNVIMRPRIPLRYDFNDVSIVKMPVDKANHIKKTYSLSDRRRRNIQTDLYRFKRTNFSLVNTFLLYLLTFMLMTASVINMKKTINILHEDPSLQEKDRLLFKVGFVLSFVVLVCLCCYLFLSLFELYRNLNKFKQTQSKNNVRYKSLLFPDGEFLSMRFIMLFFVMLTVILSIAEVFNLFFMDLEHAQILFLFVPIVFCCLLLVSIYTMNIS